LEDVALLEELEDRADLEALKAACEEVKRKGSIPLDRVLAEFGIKRSCCAMAYRVEFAPRSRRELRRLDHVTRERVIRALIGLETDPRPQLLRSSLEPRTLGGFELATTASFTKSAIGSCW
jgi:hypothetical protein